VSTRFSLKDIRFTRALQDHRFAWFWAGQTISSLGDRAFATALAVVVYQLTGSSLAMGLFLTAQMVPTLIFTLFGGVIADRFSRRLVLLCADASRVLIVFAIALLAWLHLLQLWHLFVLAVLFGCALAFFNPAYRAITPELVDKVDDRSRLWSYGLRGCCRYVLAGWLGDHSGPPMVFISAGLLMVVLSAIPLLQRSIRIIQ
jgi:MFS family permease